MRLLETPEVEESDAVSELVFKLMCQGDRDRCLTDTSRPAKRDKPALAKAVGERPDVCIPPDHPGRPRWKGGT
jgi:hypothetical protein